MKFVVDVGVGKSVENYLRKSDFELIVIRDVNPMMDDLEILKIARKNKAMVVTMDKDFGDLVHSAKEAHTGILLLRLEDATGPEKREVIEYIFDNFLQEMKDNFCVYQNGKPRIRINS